MTRDGNIDMEKVCNILKAQGIAAYVEQTGGGCATIYAGVRYLDASGDYRYPALGGPGWFNGPAWTQGTATTDDFYVGPDDDGESSDFFVADSTWTEDTVVEKIKETIKKGLVRS